MVDSAELSKGDVLTVYCHPNRNPQPGKPPVVGVYHDGKVIVFTPQNPLSMTLKPGMRVKAEVVLNAEKYVMVDPLEVVGIPPTPEGSDAYQQGRHEAIIEVLEKVSELRSKLASDYARSYVQGFLAALEELEKQLTTGKREQGPESEAGEFERSPEEA